MAAVLVAADDLTGAADAGIGFRRAGLETMVVWVDDDGAGLTLDGADVLAVDAGTRGLSPTDAASRTSALVARARMGGVRDLYKKIDSTLRGHVGPEVFAALEAWHPWSLAIVAPAFPAMGRTTLGGEQRVDGAPLAAGSVMRLMERHGLRTDHADIGRVRDGGLALLLRDAGARGVRAVVCDAETDRDLQAVADAGATLGERAMWVGSGGLAQRLPKALALTSGQGPGAPGHRLRPTAEGPILIVVGSRTSAARDQVRALVSEGVEHLAVTPQVLVAIDGAARLRDDVCRRFADNLDVVVSIASADGGREDARLPRVIGDLLQPLMNIIGGLVVTGGDTARGVLAAWGVSALHLIEEVEPGIPLSFSAGAIRRPVVTKAGGFGGAAALVAARDCIREWVREGS